MSQLLLAKELGMLANPKLGNVGEWQERHNAAVSAPKAGAERAMVTMLAGWLEYAKAHKERFEFLVGEDGYLGDPWADIGRSLTMLLNGEVGRADCGTLDGMIRDAMAQNGIKVEE